MKQYLTLILVSVGFKEEILLGQICGMYTRSQCWCTKYEVCEATFVCVCVCVCVCVLWIQAVINSTISPNMTFTKTSQKFGQWSDPRAGTVYGLGFSTEADLSKVGNALHSLT